ncbi:protein kinase domain-containing protein, partial [Haematococcus lacustris]
MGRDLYACQLRHLQPVHFGCTTRGSMLPGFRLWAVALVALLAQVAVSQSITSASLQPGSKYQLSGDISIAIDASGTANISSISQSLTLLATVVPAGLQLSATSPQTCQSLLLNFSTVLCSTKADFTGVQVFNNAISIDTWQFLNKSFSNISFVCSGVPAAALVATCAGRHIYSNSTIVPALLSLQAAHSNVSLHLASSSPFWVTPEFGWGTAANPTIIQGNVFCQSDSLSTYTWLDFRGSGTLISIPDNATLTFKHRVPRVQLRRLLLEHTKRERDYLAYWYARYLSPISSISASAQWLAGNSGLNVSISTFLTFVPDSVQYPLLPHVQRTGIMDWGVDPFTPTPLAAPVCRPDELASGLGYTQAQPYVMQNCNMRVVNNTASNSTNTSLVSPVGLSGSPALSPPPQPPGPGSSPFLALIPAGTAIWWQGHALRSFAADLAGQASAVVLGANSQLSIRNLTLLNTGTQVVDPAAVAAGSVTPHPLQLFSMALWAIGNVSSDTSMVLDMVTIVIPPEELAILHLFASGQRNCGCSLSSATQATLARMFDTSLVSTITNTSLSFGRVRAERWSGTRVTLSSDPSSTPFTLLPNSPLSDVKVVTSSAGSKHRVDLRWVVPVAVLGGLAVLAGLLAAVWVYRRRRDLQTQPSTAQKLFDMQEEGGILGTMPSSPRVNGSLGNQLGPATSMPHEQTHYKHSGSPSLDASDPSLNKYLVSTAQSVDAEWACKLDDPDGSTGPSSIQLQGSSMSHSKSWHGAGGRSWGMSSGASRQNEESSMGMVSDSFDRPGSEYGEWRPMASTESDQLLQEVRSDVGAGGKLVISGVLGAGAHAVVYKGEWRGRPVAVKCLLFQEHRVHTKRQALQEAAINTRLAHPNIVNTYTFELRAIGANAEGLPSSTGKTAQAHQKDGHMSIAEDQAVAGDWKMYIVQEYCDGGHLKRAVDSGALTEDGVTPSMLTVVNTALDIACGLQHIHSKNIIHGDLSPANILLKLDDSRLGCLKAIAKVGDFGLSHMSKDGQSHVSNVRQGTPHYTAPEVLMEGRMTRAADVYSFGVILHELY